MLKSILARRRYATAPNEYVGSFRSLDEWLAWSSSHPQILDPDYINSIVQHGQKRGVQSKFLGPIPPEEVRVADTNYRESFMARGFNPRQRIVFDLLSELPVGTDTLNTRIYAPEALSSFALALAGRYA